MDVPPRQRTACKLSQPSRDCRISGLAAINRRAMSGVAAGMVHHKVRHSAQARQEIGLAPTQQRGKWFDAVPGTQGFFTPPMSITAKVDDGVVPGCGPTPILVLLGG